jgi:hypothetical protein
MMRVSSRQRAALFVGGILIVAALAAAGLLASSGRSLDALKVLLFAMLVPGAVLLAVFFFAVVSQPSWYRSVSAIYFALFAAGAVLFHVFFFIWLPFSPMRWRFDEVPTLLAVPMLIGLAIVSVGSVIGLASATIDGWRKRDRVVIASSLVLMGILGFVFVRGLVARIT